MWSDQHRNCMLAPLLLGLMTVEIGCQSELREAIENLGPMGAQMITLESGDVIIAPPFFILRARGGRVPELEVSNEVLLADFRASGVRLLPFKWLFAVDNDTLVFFDTLCLEVNITLFLGDPCNLIFYSPSVHSKRKTIPLERSGIEWLTIISGVDALGQIWLSDLDNLYLLRQDGQIEKRLSGVNALDLFEPSAGEIWLQVSPKEGPRFSAGTSANEEEAYYHVRLADDGRLEDVAPEIPPKLQQVKVYRDRRGRLWIPTNDWLWWREAEGAQFTRFPRPLFGRHFSKYSLDVVESSSGEIFVSTHRGLYMTPDTGESWFRLTWDDPMSAVYWEKEEAFLKEVGLNLPILDPAIQSYGTLAVDGDGHLWASSLFFLIDYDPKESILNSYFMDPIHDYAEPPALIPSLGLPARLVGLPSE